ncbi:hypothetical protein [Halolamina rubra]|uniref:hypothetical protein n=1 Tax=Halolamina rubra TaxID=1380430 RepID=UPI000678E09A|nr:hypothetical protein [Halolamina rubra]
MDVVAFARRNWLGVFGGSAAVLGMYLGLTQPDMLVLAMSFLAFGAVARLIQYQEAHSKDAT